MTLGLRGAFALAVAGLSACAHVEAPSGGPEDREPPVLLVTRPDTAAVVPGWRSPVVLVFDERISERGVDQAVEVSPRTSGVVVRHSGDELRVQLREGWLPDVVYHVNVVPGLRDLFGNATREGIRLVFSTGPSIPENAAAGRVIDRTTLEPARELRVEAIRTADSLVYAAVTDSAGAFAIANLPPGDYLVRAFEDMNSNRALDGFEPRDSASATVAAEGVASVELSVVLPDSTPPQAGAARLSGRAITVSFDDFLDPAQPLPVEAVTVLGPAGAPVPVSRVAIGELAPRADTAPPPPALPADTAAPADTLAAADTAAVAEAAARRPSRDLVVELEEEAVLQPGAEYTITVRGIRNVVGLAGDASATFTAPEEAVGSVPDAPEAGATRADNPNQNQ